MAGKKKQQDSRVGEVAEQFEHAFMAGLGALSDAQKKGAERFDDLVREGERFRKMATSRTESLIDDVQDAIRGMSGDAQSRATGLLDQVRDSSRLDKLQRAFDARVADTMDRINVPSKNDIDKINRKLDKILRLLDDKGKPAAKKKTARRKTAKTPSGSRKKAATRKKVAKKTTKTTKKTAARKKAAKRKTSK